MRNEKWKQQAEKSYTGEGSASTKKLEKPVWRPKGRQLNKFRSMLIIIMKQIFAYHSAVVPLVSKAVFKLSEPSPWIRFPCNKQ